MNWRLAIFTADLGMIFGNKGANLRQGGEVFFSFHRFFLFGLLDRVPFLETADSSLGELWSRLRRKGAFCASRH